MKGKHVNGVGGEEQEVWQERGKEGVGVHEGGCERTGEQCKLYEMLSGVVQSSHRIQM